MTALVGNAARKGQAGQGVSLLSFLILFCNYMLLVKGTEALPIIFGAWVWAPRLRR